MIRRRLAVVLAALLTSLGLFLATSVPAQAVQQPYTNGYVTTVVNRWAYPVGIWDEQGRLWYPINGGTTTRWTEPTHLNIGAGYECSLYDGIRPTSGVDQPFYVYAPADRDGWIAVGDWGLTVISCWRM